MKRRLLAVLLAATMVLGSLAGCGETADESDSTDVTEVTDVTDVSNVEAEALPEALYYYSFDEGASEGIVPMGQNTGGATGAEKVYAVDKDVVRASGVTADGDALFVNGTYGYQLTDITGIDSDSYTISFWIYMRRTANYMPTIQCGTDIYGDAIGAQQHYLNFTTCDSWGENGASYPSLWSYDQSVPVWPFYIVDDGDSKTNRWVNVTLVVDGTTDIEVDGVACSQGTLYVDGQLFAKDDGEGNYTYAAIAKDILDTSDGFQFLVGVNYWDAIFKGAVDELYIYDSALTAGQALTLYQMGDPTIAYEEPDRVIEVVQTDSALYQLGSTTFDNGFWTDWSEAYEIKDGESWVVKMKNYSDGVNSYDNYVTVFTNEYSAAGTDPNAASDAHVEYAAVRADAYGWLNGDGAQAIDASAFTYTWSNWNSWESQTMVEADVEMIITREGSTLKIEAHNVDVNDTDYTMTAEVPTSLTAEDPCYFLFTNEACYTEILSVKQLGVDPYIYYSFGMDGSQIVIDGQTVGNEDGTSGFWTEFSRTYAVPEGTSKTLGFTLTKTGAANWNTVFAVLQNVPAVHSADANASYKEYAVVRADNWGWNAEGDTTALPWTLACDYDFAAGNFAEELNGAHVDLTVTNNGDTAKAEYVFTCTNGNVYTQSYDGIVIDGDLHFCVGVDGSCLTLDPVTVGNDDGSSAWWTAFSDVFAVAEGTSDTIGFTVTYQGENQWNNFVTILTNKASGHEGDGYLEYAVVRPDNYGWGSGYDGYALPEFNWGDDLVANIIACMQDAHVNVTVTNNGDTADIMITVDGTDYYQSYTGINVAH